MYITKITGVILTITSCSLMGFYVSMKMKYRLRDLNELKKLILILRGEIRYAKTTLPEALIIISKRSNGVFKAFFENVSKSLSDLEGISFRELWEKGIEEDLKDVSLNSDDKNCLKQLGDNLGYLDIDMQLNIIDLYISQLELHIKELSSGIKDKSRLYNCLGVMGGILITIVII